MEFRWRNWRIPFVNYFIWQDEQQKGPFTMGQLRSMWANGQLTVNDFYWMEGMQDWSALAELREELELIRQTAEPPPLPFMPPPLPITPAGMACPYCGENISDSSTRCKHCGGELLFCSRCRRNVAVTIKRKFVGLMRGGTQEVKKCRNCNKQLAGPLW